MDISWCFRDKSNRLNLLNFLSHWCKSYIVGLVCVRRLCEKPLDRLKNVYSRLDQFDAGNVICATILENPFWTNLTKRWSYDFHWTQRFSKTLRICECNLLNVKVVNMFIFNLNQPKLTTLATFIKIHSVNHTLRFCRFAFFANLCNQWI